MKVSLMILAAVLVGITAHAQERTAGSTLDTQMTWSTLSNKISQVDGKIGGVKILIDQTIVCARKGMLYAPGEGGLDAQGCKEAHKANENITNITSLVNTINTLTNNYNTLNNSVTQIINCNKNGQVYNGSGCVGSATNVVAVSGSGKATCPANTIRVSCLASSESNVAYPANGCTASHTQSKSTGNTGGWEGSWTVQDHVTAMCIANN